LARAFADNAAIVPSAGEAGEGDEGGDLFSFDSAYQSIRIVEEKTEDNRTERLMLVGGGRASGIFADTGLTRLQGDQPVQKPEFRTVRQKPERACQRIIHRIIHSSAVAIRAFLLR
jgi:hypothetical protein